MYTNLNKKTMKDIGTLEYTLIESEPIIGFNLWGERRICLPQLFRFVLPEFDINVIDRAVTDLQINCFQCNLEQMKLLHAHKIVPVEVILCGLIRKSDAERLCKYLLQPNKNCDKLDETVNLNDHKSIFVIHTCFGEQRGTLYPGLYTSPDSKCIKCSTCDNLFKTFEFVGHTHKLDEVSNTFHWGFDSNNWRLLLQLCTVKDKSDIKCLRESKTILDRVKSMFYGEELTKISKSNMNSIWRPSRRWRLPNPPKPPFPSSKPTHLNDGPVEYFRKSSNAGLENMRADDIGYSNCVPNVYLNPKDSESNVDDDDIDEFDEVLEKPIKNSDDLAMNIALEIKRQAEPKDPITLGTISAFCNRKDMPINLQSRQINQSNVKPLKSNCSPVVVAPAHMSIPPPFLMLEALWSQLFRDIIQLTHLVQFNTNDERNRLVGQLIRCQDLFRTQWTNLAEENQGLKENLLQEQKRSQDMEIIRDKMTISLKEFTVENENLNEKIRKLESRCEQLQTTVNATSEIGYIYQDEDFERGQNLIIAENNNDVILQPCRMKSKRQFDYNDNIQSVIKTNENNSVTSRKQIRLAANNSSVDSIRTDGYRHETVDEMNI